MFFKTTDKQIPRSWGFNREVKRSYSDYIFRMNIAYDKIHAETGYHELVAKGLRYGLIKTVYVTISETVGLGRVKYVELQDGEICYYLLRQRIVHYERENPDAVLDTRSQR